MNQENFIVVDSLTNADTYTHLNPRLAIAFEFLRENQDTRLEPGDHEIDGREVYVAVIRGELRPLSEAKLEAHRKYLDVHYLRSAEESIAWKQANHCEVETEYNTEKDYLLFSDVPEESINLLPGQFAIIYPDAAHAPMIGSGELDKFVVKVKI